MTITAVVARGATSYEPPTGVTLSHARQQPSTVTAASVVDAGDDWLDLELMDLMIDASLGFRGQAPIRHPELDERQSRSKAHERAWGPVLIAITMRALNEATRMQRAIPGEEQIERVVRLYLLEAAHPLSPVTAPRRLEWRARTVAEYVTAHWDPTWRDRKVSAGRAGGLARKGGPASLVGLEELTRQQQADRLGVSLRTVQTWAREAKIQDSGQNHRNEFPPATASETPSISADQPLDAPAAPSFEFREQLLANLDQDRAPRPTHSPAPRNLVLTGHSTD